MSLAKCPVCNAPAKIEESETTRKRSVQCMRCGPFRCDHYALIALRKGNWSVQQVATASGFIRRNPGLFLTVDQVEHLATLEPPSPSEKAARILLELAKQSPQPGVFLKVAGGVAEEALGKLGAETETNEYSDDLLDSIEEYALQLLAIGSLSGGIELDWFLHKVLAADGLLDSDRMFPHGSRAYKSFSLSPQGWREVARLRETNAGSRFGFVAMSFQPAFVPLFDHGIMAGIKAAGYEAERVDRTEHNNRIDDEIIARIKRSRFLVADFSVQRGGIYFEAGYALGLGLPVIWLVQEESLAEVHFDNRQYNFITWKEGEWDALRDRLHFRIEATIGRGPVIATDLDPR